MTQELQTVPVPAAKYVLTEERADALLSGTDEDYLDKLRSGYLLNLMNSTPMESPFAHKICSGFDVVNSVIPDFTDDKSGFPFKKKTAGNTSAYPNRHRPERNSVDKRDWDFLTERLQDHLKNFDPGEDKSVMVDNLEVLAKHLMLSELDTEILIFFAVVNENPLFKTMARHMIGDEPSRLPAALSRFLGKPKEVSAISACLEQKSVLMNCGLLNFFADGDEDVFFHDLEEDIKALISVPELDPATFVEGVLGKPTSADLEIADFAANKDDIEMICQIISNALKNGEEGINILLFGPPGSGKTAMAASIAKHLDLSMFAVGEDEDQNLSHEENKTSSRHRLNKLFQAHSFLKGNTKAILFFDELEDLLIKGTDSSKKSDTESKIVVNRLLETNPVVTIWAGNDPDKFPESFRQRFSYVVYVGYQPMMTRKKVWEKRLEMKNMVLPPQDVVYLARHYSAPPRMIANAIKMASLTDNTVENIENFLKSSSKITNGDSEAIRATNSISEKFDPELMNYDGAKDNRLKAISGPSPRPYSLLLRGKPGTGVKSLARYLAEGAIMNTAEHDMRSLIEPNPMAPPEAKIRYAFQAANDSKELLVISNIDALAIDAKSSSANWNESGLAEVFMECAYNHRGPMIASCYNTDIEIPGFVTAVFSHDIELKSLSEEQSGLAYKTYFGKEYSGDSLPKNLVPADFSKVAKVLKRGLNGSTPEPEIIAMLKSQVNNRQSRSGMGIRIPA